MKIKNLATAIIITTLLCGAYIDLAQAQNSKNKRSLNISKKNRTRSNTGGVRFMFDRAQKFYRAEKFGEAVIAYDQILKKYPTHEPSMIQMAKSLYRLERFRESFNVFTKINPQYLDPETSYQYGWTFYKSKKYEGALYAFNRVPKGYSLFDLANYYGAISAIKLKKYEDAADMLDKAMVLPDKLAKSKVLYHKHIQALLVMKKKSELAQERHNARRKLRAKRSKRPGSVPPPTTISESTEHKHKGTMSIYRAASIEHASESQTIDFHGFNKQFFQSETTSFNGYGGPLIPIPYILDDRQAAIGAQVFLSVEKKIKSGDEQRVIVDESNQDLLRIQEQDLGQTDTNAGSFDIAPWMEFPLIGESWLLIGGSFYFYYPEFNRGDRFGTRKGYMKVSGPFHGVDISGDMAYSENVDSETLATTTIISGEGTANYATKDGLSLLMVGKHKVFDYLRDEMNGPDTFSSISIAGEQSLPFGFAFKATGSADSQSNYINYNIPNFGAVSADGVTYTGIMKLYFSPPVMEFLALSVQQLFSYNQWNVQNEAAVDQWQLNTPELIDQLIIKGSINLAF